jgi:hypothetical protein
MRKKIIGIFICTLLITTILPMTGTVLAGDEENPEIEDEEQEDWDIFGPLIKYPSLFRFFTLFGILDIESFDVIDIVSAWFYENPDEPEYLCTAIKLEDLEFINQRTIYSVHWKYDGTKYGVGIHTHSNGQYISCFAGEDRTRELYESVGSFDLENNIVTFKMLKEFIGNPQPGDILTKTFAWTALRFTFEPVTVLFGGELAKDYAPGVDEEAGDPKYGKDYTIKY